MNHASEASLESDFPPQEGGWDPWLFSCSTFMREYSREYSQRKIINAFRGRGTHVGLWVRILTARLSEDDIVERIELPRGCFERAHDFERVENRCGGRPLCTERDMVDVRINTELGFGQEEGVNESRRAVIWWSLPVFQS